MTQSTPPAAGTRRDFLATSAAALSGAALASLPGATPAVHAGGSDVLRIGLVGCGSRGTGAATQALNADPHVKLVTLGDAFADRLQSSLENLRRDDEIAKKIDVTPERCFVGFDAYKQVLASDIDVVLLATPPHFRPAHLKAAVEAGKHAFVEKPVVGDITALHCTYNIGYLWNYPRKPGWSDMEWQLRNWLYFTWLSGDHIVEQHIHSLDKMAWAMKDEPPVKASGMGGRQVRTGPEFGNIFDHHAVVFEYKSGVKLFSYCRQLSRCANEVSDFIIGTTGTCDVMHHAITGARPWRYKAPPGLKDDMYQNEHDAMYAALRAGKPINNGDYMTKSTLMAILGRMATYTGQVITWEMALNSKENLTPSHYEFGPLPVPPVALPGVTKFV